MAHGKLEMSLALVLVTIMWSGAIAQSDCTNVLISMSPCLNYITGNSSTPSSQCCTQLASVVRSSPGACNVQTPPVSRCNAASPAASPAGSPKPQATPSGVGKGSTTVPSTEADGTSDGSSVKLSISLLFFLLFAAYGSAFGTY